MPETLDERAEVYRSRMAGRRVLVVLDDAAGESQVEPLIPAGAGIRRPATSPRSAGHLPPALRIAGARLVAHPHSQAGWLVERLADTHRRLERAGPDVNARVTGATRHPSTPLGHFGGQGLTCRNRIKRRSIPTPFHGTRPRRTRRSMERSKRHLVSEQ
ncbi:hypothetical protein ACBJ59_56500 [Nonomuraea sp. MTCD27]|uniref:hypothetical protein n=1 Tax=Nonomuraea sp. MTCD27 TaxID=1676747 RepID=UPI0035BF220C